MEKVILKNENLRSLFYTELNGTVNDSTNYIIKIPDYQRIYCWEENNVTTLLEDILNYSHDKYHLGTIILQVDKSSTLNVHNIVDGQQRLVTLALLLQKLAPTLNFSLLDEVFYSEEAHEFIAYNKYLIRNYIDNNDVLKDKIQSILDNIQFSVLVIEESNLDLAYTFFSNQNSKGIPLSDYSLLKAHHLRYIQAQDQAEHLAKRWDSVILNSENDEKDNLNKIFDKYLFRLRKWVRKNDWNNDEKHRIKIEFEAAPFIQKIPAFAGSFKYSEVIQGGARFFAYADHFIYTFQIFSQTEEYKLLQQHLSYDRHWWYRDIAEAFLFVYYTKFGDAYLEDALKGILFLLSDHRYSSRRVDLNPLLRFAGDKEILIMIEQSTSPTFFLAALQKECKLLKKYSDLKGTRLSYQNAISMITKDRNPTVIFNNNARK